MLICKVIGNVWATKKDPTLDRSKLMIVQRINHGQQEKNDAYEPSFVAVDVVGAGIGEEVLVVTGSSARTAAGKEAAPIDAAIIGIIDSVETNTP